MQKIDQHSNIEEEEEEEYDDGDDNEKLICGKYKKIDYLYTDESSKIYKVSDKATGNIFMAKIISTKNNENVGNEVAVLQRLSHPSIIKCHDYFPINYMNENPPILILDYCPKGSLYNILNRERYGEVNPQWNDTTKLITIYGIASGMSYLHSQNIVHRSLGSSSILFDENMKPKITNFDFSINLPYNNDVNKACCGCPPYIAPEIWTENNYSLASDVYAFGMILYEIVTGSKLFEGYTACNIMYKVAVQKKRPEIPNGVNEALKNLIYSCWNDDPNRRPSFQSILNELRTNDSITNNVDVNAFRSSIHFFDNQ